MKNKSFNFITYLLILLGTTLYAQERRKIEIEYAPFMTFDESIPDATILTRDNSKQVHIRHEGIEMWCDEAIYDAMQNHQMKVVLTPFQYLVPRVRNGRRLDPNFHSYQQI